MTPDSRDSSPPSLPATGGARSLGPEHRLAVYGSLAPGEANADRLEPVDGEWLDGGRVRGRLHRSGWGAAHGYPGLEWDPDGEEVPVRVFVSADLPGHWTRLDAFEGSDYRRILVPVEGLPGGTRRCNIYVIADPGPLRRPG